MNIIVKNDHHFCKGVELLIEKPYTGISGRQKWKISSEDQKYKYGTCSLFGKNSPFEEDRVLNPEKSREDFIHLLELIFEFTGTGAEYLKIENGDNVNKWDIVESIYNTPLEHNIQLIHISHYDCNMGHCSGINDASIDEREYKTYGDVMELFGNKVEDKNGRIYYAYPDSAWLHIKETTGEKHVGCYCVNKGVPITEKLNSDKIYLLWGYGR